MFFDTTSRLIGVALYQRLDHGQMVLRNIGKVWKIVRMGVNDKALNLNIQHAPNT